MRILLLGGHGFIGRALQARLRRADHSVVCPPRQELDLARMLSPSDWRPWLGKIDLVINAAGILRPRAADQYSPIHHLAPLAMAQACVELGVKGVVQISALGDPRDSEFIASKQRFDQALLALPLPAIVLRPSVVYSPYGSYGGSSLLRALAALPGGLLLPGSGEQQLQPIDMDSLAEAVLRSAELLESTAAGLGEPLQLVGPERLALADYLSAWRAWLGYPPGRRWQLPIQLIDIAAWVGERFASGALNQTIWRMLQRDNVGSRDALELQAKWLRLDPPTLADVLDRHPAQLQDRWQARLWLLAPLLTLSLAVLWIGSGLTGLLMDQETVARMAAPLGLGGESAQLLALATSWLDLLLGGAVLLSRWRRPALLLMLLSTLGYTIILGSLAPALWSDPFGGLLKNLPLIPALLIAWVLADRR